MRQGRAQSRGSSRQSASSPSPSLGSTLVKRSMKLPQIVGVQDDSTSPNNGQENSGLVVGVCSQQGKRPYQEDEYSVRQFLNQSSPASENETNVETHFFGLFDGHAGGRCSNYVAGTLPNVLAEDSSFFSNLPQALKRSFHQTNEMFLKVAEKMKYHDGSTGITAVVRDSKVLVANVGDCRCLIISGGRPIQMSIDQKPTNPEEQKRIVALGGTVVYCMGVARVNRVLAVSRAFGNRTLRSVIRPDAEMMQRELTKDDDFLVMASDGLWDVLKNKDVCDMCYSPFAQGTPQVIADELVQAALMRGSMDNVTCIVVRLTDYVKRLFSGGVGGRPAATGTATAGGHTSFGTTGAAAYASNGSTRGGVVGREGETLERSSSLKNIPGSNTSQRLNANDHTGSNNNNSSSNGVSSGTLPIPMTRQYSTGSISATAGSGRHELSGLQHPSSTQMAPTLDNSYLYSPNSRNRATSGAGGDSPSFLPSATGSSSPGIASLRQHMNRDGSFNFDEDDQLAVSQSSSSSTPAWMSQQANSTSGSGYGHSGGVGMAAVPYAARRPSSTMGGGAGNILNNPTRASLSTNTPSLISMFNNTIPQQHSNGNNTASAGLAPISAGNSPMTNSNNKHTGLWNSESDYSGSSQLDHSGSGSGSRYGHGSYTQKPSSLATMFPINYKRPPSKK